MVALADAVDRGRALPPRDEPERGDWQWTRRWTPSPPRYQSALRAGGALLKVTTSFLSDDLGALPHAAMPVRRVCFRDSGGYAGTRHASTSSLYDIMVQYSILIPVGARAVSRDKI